MNYKLIIIFLFILSSCDQAIYNKNKKTNTVIFDRYKNSGFALIYSDNLKDIKKIMYKVGTNHLYFFMIDPHFSSLNCKKSNKLIIQ